MQTIENPQIAALGLAYKANVDDARESPSVTVIQHLQAAGCQVQSCDPYVKESPVDNVVDSLDAAVQDADCLLILTDHRQFKAMTPAEIAPKMRHKILLDTRNALPHAKWRNAGFEMHTIGNG